MRHLKKCLFSFVFLLVLIALLFPCKAWADYSEGDYRYTVSGGKATVTEYLGQEASVVVPSKLGGYPVAALGSKAFFGNVQLEEVSLPDTLTSIGYAAFKECSSLQNVVISGTVLEHIGGSAFQDCSALGSISIPESVWMYGQYAFYGMAENSAVYVSTPAQYKHMATDPAYFFDKDLTWVLPLYEVGYDLDIWRTFPDVRSEAINAGGPDKVWYIADGWLDYVTEAGLMGGYATNGWFGPYDNITRGQVAVILYRAACADEPSLVELYGSTTDPAAYAEECAFEDMEAGQYYTAAVNWAKDAGVLTGDAETSFATVRPDDSIARQELCLMLARYVNDGLVPATQLDPAKAEGIKGMNQIASWAKDGVYWAVNNGVIGGVDNGNGTFSMNPAGKTWRSAAAKMFTVVMRDILE